MKTILLVLLTAVAMLAFAIDISGNWEGTADFNGNAIKRTFTFKVQGKKLTGETNSEMLGKSTINDGVVDGDKISFSINANLQGNETKVEYKGTIHSDNTITLNANVQGNNIEWQLKKSS